MGYKYTVGYAPTGRALCRGCGKKIAKGALRISRDSGPIAQFNDHSIVNHFHSKHAFDAMQRGLCTSKVVLKQRDLIGVNSLTPEDRTKVVRHITTFSRKRRSRCLKKKSLHKRTQRTIRSRARSKSRN